MVVCPLESFVWGFETLGEGFGGGREGGTGNGGSGEQYEHGGGEM